MTCNSGAEPICIYRFSLYAISPEHYTTNWKPYNKEEAYMAFNIINRWLINYPSTILEVITLAIM